MRSCWFRGARFAAGGGAIVAALAVSLAAAPAGAVVARLGGQGYGVTPMTNAAEGALVSAYRAHHALSPSALAGAHNEDGLPFGGGELETQGGPVMHSATTHVVYWDPNEEFSAATKGIVDGFFANVAHDSGLPTNVFAIAGQYADSTGNAAYSSTFAGAVTDKHAYPTTGNCTTPNELEADKGPYAKCLFDAQLKAELSGFVAENGLPVGPSQLYLVLLPHSVATCLPEVISGKQVCSNNFYCAYHSYVNPGSASEIVYADIPFSLLDTNFVKGCQDDGHALNLQQPNPDNGGGKNSETRFADVALKYISHETIEAITDPLVGAQTAWVDDHGLEIGDKCNGVSPDGAKDGVGYDPNAFLPVLGGTVAGDNLFDQSIDTGRYYLQSEWDNGGRACLMRPLSLGAASFTTSSAATAGSAVAFNGGASDPYTGLELNWSFGDGATASGTRVSHAYGSPGVYTVTLTPRDRLTGSTGEARSQPISVAAPVQSASSTSSPVATSAASPNSSFSPHASFNAKTGAITLSASVADAGTFSWLATFANGTFGAFSSSLKCKLGFNRLAGKCRPARITFAKGSRTVAAGSVTLTLKPSASAAKALRNALKRNKRLPVTVKLTFLSSRGGGPTSHAVSVTVKLKR